AAASRGPSSASAVNAATTVNTGCGNAPTASASTPTTRMTGSNAAATPTKVGVSTRPAATARSTTSGTSGPSAASRSNRAARNAGDVAAIAANPAASGLTADAN